MWPAIGIANSASHIAVIADVDDRQRGMLHVVGKQTTVVWTAEFHRRVDPQRHLGWLDVNLAAGAPVIRIGSNQHLALAVRRTPFVHPDAVHNADEIRL